MTAPPGYFVGFAIIAAIYLQGCATSTGFDLTETYNSVSLKIRSPSPGPFSLYSDKFGLLSMGYVESGKIVFVLPAVPRPTCVIILNARKQPVSIRGTDSPWFALDLAVQHYNLNEALHRFSEHDERKSDTDTIPTSRETSSLQRRLRKLERKKQPLAYICK